MTKLEEARLAINRIDAEMAKLFCERMEAVGKVAEYKKELEYPTTFSSKDEANNLDILRASKYSLGDIYTLLSIIVIISI